MSMLVLYIRRASSVQKGLHNLSISLHAIWRDRDKPLETREIFPGCIAGPLVAWSKPMLCPLLSGLVPGFRHFAAFPGTVGIQCWQRIGGNGIKMCW